MSSKNNVSLVPKLRFPEFRAAEVWEVKPFKRLFSIGNGRDYKHLSKGDVPVYGSGGYMLSVNDFLYDGESVCIGRKGTINNPMLLSGKFWTVDTLFYTHSFQQCTPRFIFSIFQNIDWLKHNEAGGVPSLSKTNIEKIEAAIPRLPEQLKINDCLSSLDELINAQARKVDALQTHKRGLMQHLFRREDETYSRLRFPQFRGAGEWNSAVLGELSEVVRGGSPRPIDGFLTAAADGLNWLKIGDVNKDAKFVTKTAQKVRPEALSKTRVVNAGDLILSNSMSFGRPYILKIRTCIHDGWIAITSIAKEIERDFLYYSISAASSQIYFEDNAAGSGVQNLNAEIIKSLPVIFPCMPEQQRISDCLTSIDDLITSATQEVETLKTHKKGLMLQLFPSAQATEA